MPDAAWLIAAKALPCGSSMKIFCCSTTPSMIVNHSAAGYSAHCFKCKQHPCQSKGERSLHDLKKEQEELLSMQDKTIRLPHDTVSISSDTVPNDALWFLKFGISMDDAAAYNFGYSKFFDRVVIPVYDLQGNLKVVQMRDYTGTNPPKWLASANKKQPGIFYTHPTSRNPLIIITEDIISALKVGKVHPACSILGSDIGDIRAAHIAARFDVAFIWLDGDKAGRLGALDMEKQLILQGMLRVERIRTDKDPKCYSQDEISSIITKEAQQCLT